MRKTQFQNFRYYHIYNRGVEKRDIFISEENYLKFLKILKECKDKLVDIICYSLIPNHFHFLLLQLVENGITQFMHKIGTSYGMYFNIKNERKGPLFESRFKDVEVKTIWQLLHLSRYIHINIAKDLDKTIEEKMKILENYPWSSYPNYINSQNFQVRPGLKVKPQINMEVIKSYFGKNNFEVEYREFIKEGLIYEESKKIAGLLLE